jgi:hypothetical protein
LYVKVEPRLIVLDAFKAHLTPAVHTELRKQKTTLSAILGGCTGLVQPLDVSINKPLKALIKEEQDNHWDQHLEEWEAGKFNIGDRRVLLTHWVARAWKRLHEEKKDVIIQSFQQVGLSLNPDRSEDLEIKIKDLEGIEVGKWELEVDVTQEEDEDSAALEAVLEAEKAPKLPLVLEDDLSNSDKLDINITKASLRPGR